MPKHKIIYIPLAVSALKLTKYENAKIAQYCLIRSRWALPGEGTAAIFLLQETGPIRYSLKQFRLKEVYKVQMKRVVLLAILKICAEAILLALIVGVVVGVIGNKNAWNTSIAYSNAFFVAGCLMIVAGGMSRMAAGQEWRSYQRIYAESFRNMNAGDRANFIINASSSFRLVLLGMLSGILLILSAVLVTKIF